VAKESYRYFLKLQHSCWNYGILLGKSLQGRLSTTSEVGEKDLEKFCDLNAMCTLVLQNCDSVCI
jgi:hypothetical protein